MDKLIEILGIKYEMIWSIIGFGSFFGSTLFALALGIARIINKRRSNHSDTHPQIPNPNENGRGLVHQDHSPSLMDMNKMFVNQQTCEATHKAIVENQHQTNKNLRDIFSKINLMAIGISAINAKLPPPK